MVWGVAISIMLDLASLLAIKILFFDGKANNLFAEKEYKESDA